ncbi:MAG TPA: flagellar export protein FliJ [Tepidisphaeraceae bacterium]|jgi:flagellar FliJ protein|nr:flagellar export protein FliJ [Tepidisphaeraceae bacterium]
MAQFTFTLEGVLRHRTHVEQDRQRDLARVQAQMRDAENELRQLDQTLSTSLGDVRENRLTGKLDLGFLAAYRRYVASVHRKGSLIAQKMALIQRQVESAQNALAEAAKQRKIIEKLREKQFDQWKREQSRKEAAELDEVSMRLVGWRASLAEEELKEEELEAGQ